MAKMRVNEMTKVLVDNGHNVANKDIIKLLNDNGFSDVKSHSSNIDDDAIEFLNKHFKIKADQKSVHGATDTESKEGVAVSDDKKKALRPKKKKNISVVVNKNLVGGNRGGQGNRSEGRKRAPERGARRTEGRNANSARPESRRPIKPRPESERTVRPQATMKKPGEEELVILPAPEKVAAAKAAKEKKAQKKSAPQVEAAKPTVEVAAVKPNKETTDNKETRDNRDNKGKKDKKNKAESGANRNKNQNHSQNQNQSQKPNQNTSGNKKGKDKKKSKDKSDALGKKQERYFNLEKKERNKKHKAAAKLPQERKSDEILTLVIPERLTIKELADKMEIAPSAIVKKLFMKGTIVTVNQSIEYEQAEEIALEYNCICEPEEKVDVIEELLREEEENPKDLVSRPPVVCVMGHVDHGKTSLLDAIRDTRVTAREAGGITQKIGAYVVSANGSDITFLDTPGHEAFTAMRMRGANSTDIAILVVAADDGVMPQTVEAINHAKAAGIEIIVAINKIDKPNANIERVKQELSEYELIPEDWGGSTIFVPVSAHTHEGIDQLLDMILLTAEVMELKSNPKRNARGLVIEAELDKGRGAVATVLVQKGTLKVGDPVAAGSSFGRVRAMINDNGENVKSAGPSVPVEIFGLSEVPNAGEIIVAMDSEKEARNFAATFVSENKSRMVEESRMKVSLDDLFTQIQAGNLKELDIIVKADVQGSVEAVRQSLEKLSNEEVVVKVIHGGVGAITESDVNLASASNAIIIGFNVRADAIAKQTADQEGVDIKLYNVIYKAIEDVESAMKGMLEPVYEEKVIGHAEVRQIFKSSDVGNIAGSYILDGYFERNCKIRITRDDEQIYEGTLASLKRFKDDVKEVKAGYECGLVFDGFDSMAEEDKIEAYIMVEIPREKL